MKDVFDGNEFSIERENYTPDGSIELGIQYSDFASTDWVRSALTRRMPGVQLTLMRWYSDSVIHDAIREMLDEFIEVWCYDYDGRPVKLSINQLVEAWLSDKEVRNGVAIYPRRAMEEEKHTING